MSDCSAAPPLTKLCLWNDLATDRDGATNMAVDEALLSWSAASGKSVLRFYRWAGPALSFGYFLPLADAEAERRPDEELIRRWTGGGLVHHADAFTWSLTVPRTEAFHRLRPAHSYGRLHAVLSSALNDAGLGPVSVTPPETTAPPGGLCAEAPAPGDLIRAGQKLAGAGQRRTRHGLLHQGVIFLPESVLPGEFPDTFARFLARSAQPFPVENAALAVPIERYPGPDWNARR